MSERFGRLPLPTLTLTFAAQAGLLAALAATAIGCSDSSSGGAITGADNNNGNGDGTVDPFTLKLETEVIGEARAGVAFAVKCRTFKPVVADDANQGYGADVPLPSAATVTIVSGPGQPVAIDGVNVTMAKTGMYKVACQLPAYKLVDLTPADLEVIAGPAVTLDTLLLPPAGSPPGTPAPTDVVANTPVAVTCTAEDKFGNELVDGFVVQVAPADAPQPKAFVVQQKIARDYQIACVVDGKADQTPALLHVHPDVPVHLFALLDPPEVGAGGASSVTCVANDMYGNPIPDFPFSIDFSGDKDVKLTGLYVTSTKAGAHKVACVPETGDWNAYQLHPASLLIDPGPPALLVVQTVPAKQVYADSDKVQFLSSVKDAYDNLIPTATVTLAVTDPAKGYKVIDPKTVRFNVDAKYNVHLQVDQAPDIAKDVQIIVDGTPPLLTIDYPNWGDTLTGKPSVQVTGTAADDTSGLAGLLLTPNWDDAAKKKPILGGTDPDTGASQWASQVPAKHGLNTAKVEVTDLGGQTSKATRGYYYSGQYYPTDGAHPKDAPVVDGIQIYLGKDFLDDGVHDYNNPNDLATIIEMALAGMDLNALLPPNLNQGAIEVKVTNVSIKKPTVSLQPFDGGMKMHIWINDFYADVAVKAKTSIGPISVTVKVSGNMTMSQIEVAVTLGVSVKNGSPTVQVVSSKVDLKDFKLHLNGLLGLFDSIADMIIKGYIGTIETAITQLLDQQIPPLLLGILNAFTINQAVPLPALLPGMPATTLTLNSWLTTLQFTANGLLVKLNAELSAPKGTAHVNLGSIGRYIGCPGQAPDAFVIDTKQRMQLALHDDVINQALHAMWYGGALKFDGVTAAQLGLAGAGAPQIGGFSLDGATFDVDLFLAPIVESCSQPTSMDLRVQAGDVYLKANLKLGDQPLSIGIFANADLPASLALVKDPATGVLSLAVKIDASKLNLMMEVIDITKDFSDAKSAFEDILTTQINAQLSKGIPGLDNISVPLPAIDLGSLIPGMAPGMKLTLTLKDLVRAGGYSAISAQIN
jgi:hypothetical protein